MITIKSLNQCEDSQITIIVESEDTITLVYPCSLPAADFNPVTPTETIPSETDTLIIRKGPLGWFTFTWAKLLEWLGTHFSPFRIAAPTASYAAVALNDTLQDIGGKVLGLQNNVVADIELIEAVSTISIDVDIAGDFGILIYCPLFVDVTATPTVARIYIRLNNNSSAVYGWSTAYTNCMTANGTVRASQFSSQIFYSIGNEFIVQQGNYYESGREIYPGNTNGLNAVNGINNIQFLTLTAAMMAIGTRIKVIRL